MRTPASLCPAGCTSASPEGVPFQPYGHHNQVNSNLTSTNMDIGGDVRLGQITYAYIDGTCQGWLPRGDVIVDVARGFEYEPLRTKVAIEPGQSELTLRIKRWTNMNAQRWFSGDSHVHFLSSQGALTEAQGEDLNVVNLLQSPVGEPVHQHRGLHRRAQRVSGWGHDRLRLAGEPAALHGPPDPLGPEEARDALVHQWSRGGRDRRHAGDDHERLGRPVSRSGRNGHSPAYREFRWGDGGADGHGQAGRHGVGGHARGCSRHVTTAPSTAATECPCWPAPTRCRAT